MGVDKRFIETMRKNLEKRGLSYEYFFSAKPKDYIFPWEIVDLGVNKAYLREYFEKYEKFIADHPDALAYEEERMNKEAIQLMTKCEDHKLCGCCNETDLELQIKQQLNEDPIVDLNKLNIIDDKSVVEKVLLKVRVPEERRFVPNEHWEFQIRRACYLTGVPVAKDSIRIRSNIVKWRNWVAGIDYVEVGFTKRHYDEPNPKLIYEIFDKINEYLVKIRIDSFVQVLSDYSVMRDTKDCLTFYEMVVDKDINSVKQFIEVYNSIDYIEMILKVDQFRKGIVREKVNLKDYCKNLWLKKDGSRLLLCLLLKGQASPYDVYCALFKKQMAESLKYCAIVEDVFQSMDEKQDDFFRNQCTCGAIIPSNLLGEAFDETFCPICKGK